MKVQRFLFLLLFGLIMGNVVGQTRDVFDVLATPDAATDAKVTFHQDDRIRALFRQKGKEIKSGTVYRVQVFSSNNQQTARTQAFNIEKLLKESFPEQQIYVNYLSPFWKVRVGGFSSRAEAQQLRENVVDALPDLRNQIYVITDRSGSR